MEPTPTIREAKSRSPRAAAFAARQAPVCWGQWRSIQEALFLEGRAGGGVRGVGNTNLLARVVWLAPSLRLPVGLRARMWECQYSHRSTVSVYMEPTGTYICASVLLDGMVLRHNHSIKKRLMPKC